jgi:hypothetical protein
MFIAHRSTYHTTINCKAQEMGPKLMGGEAEKAYCTEAVFMFTHTLVSTKLKIYQ